jgi:hypothetical protein
MTTEYVEREGLIFEFGDYPDKGFSLTAEEFAAANPDGGAGALVDLEHFRKAHPLRGKLGGVVSTEVRGNALFGKVRWPRPLDDLIGEDPRKVSCHFDADKRLVQLDLVLNPRIEKAALFSAADPEAPAIQPEADGVIKAPAFEFAAYAAPVPMEAMRSIAQDFHDIAANCMPGLCSGQAVFARGDMTKRHWQLVHTKAMNHGATCKAAGRFSEESEMSDIEKTAEAAVVFTADEKADLLKQLAAMQAANRKLQEDSILKDGAVFAENEVRAGRAKPTEREPLARLYVRAAMDDAATPAGATFSVGDFTFSASRVADLRAFQAARPQATEGGTQTTNGHVAAPTGWVNGHVFSGDDSADPNVITDARKAELLKIAGK